MTLSRLAMVVALGAATALTLRVGRGYPWFMAGIAGLAVAVLGGMALRTLDQLLRIWRPRDGGSDNDRPDEPGGRS